MAEASPRTWRGCDSAGEEEAARGAKASWQGSAREEWRVLGAGKSLPPSLQLGHNLNPQPEEERAEAGPSLRAQMEDQFLHLTIRKQVSYSRQGGWF
ncbi:Hypothetical predicted protein [Podarcis lilfordi]|uniref:Uncharacterized protein n=1 Tax=Podarcis lilfordi TaxID=74358 RepID=A0AA35JQ53_9SAUR|nr:Hypothetical predicted protein [Podarcis lilfordi]